MKQYVVGFAFRGYYNIEAENKERAKEIVFQWWQQVKDEIEKIIKQSIIFEVEDVQLSHWGEKYLPENSPLSSFDVHFALKGNKKVIASIQEEAEKLVIKEMEPKEYFLESCLCTGIEFDLVCERSF